MNSEQMDEWAKTTVGQMVRQADKQTEEKSFAMVLPYFINLSICQPNQSILTTGNAAQYSEC
jgi:hypothetical protein